MTNHDQQLVKGTTTILLLSLLASEPMHGYRLVRTLEERCQGQLKFKEGTIYPLLYSLEDRGMIKSRWTVASSGRKRKDYLITSAGNALLKKRLGEWKQLVDGMQMILGTL